MLVWEPQPQAMAIPAEPRSASPASTALCAAKIRVGTSGTRRKAGLAHPAAKEGVWATCKLVAQFWDIREPSSGMRTLRAAHTRS